MNDPRFLAIAAWRTRNTKRHIRAENLAKDYGLSRLQPSLYVGRLSEKERVDFQARLAKLFTGKLDQLHFLGSCRSCALQSNIPEIVKKHYHRPSFEIV